MERRKFLKGAALGAGAAALATPALAQGGKQMTIVSTWPRDFPGLGVSAQRLAARIAQVSDGAFNVEYFAAGERVGAFDSFDEVASGNSQAISALIITGAASTPVSTISPRFRSECRPRNGKHGLHLAVVRSFGTSCRANMV